MALDAALGSMYLMSRFCDPGLSGRKPHNIDASRIITALRNMTAMMDRRYLEENQQQVATSGMDVDGQQQPKSLPDCVWTSGEMPRILLEVIRTHISSYASEEDCAQGGPSPVGPATAGENWATSSWNGIAATTHLYMHGVLGLRHIEQPSLGRLSRRLLLVVVRDLTSEAVATGRVAETKATSRALWLWKAFVGAFYLDGLLRAGLVPSSDSGNEQAAFMSVRLSLYGFIRDWCRSVGTTCWADAKTVLTRVVWPTAYVQPGAAETVWEEALGEGRGGGEYPAFVQRM